MKRDIYIRYVGGRNNKYWATTKNTEVTLSNGDNIVIPKGFLWDLSSVPKFLWGIFPPFGDFLIASLVHDYLYVNKQYSRAFADKEMLYFSNKYNSNKIDNYLRYVAVRLFGFTYWNK